MPGEITKRIEARLKKELMEFFEDEVGKLLEEVALQIESLELKIFKGAQGDQGIIGKDGAIGTQGPVGGRGLAGISGIDGKSGEAGKSGKDGSADNAKQIAKKLNTLEEAIDQSVIKGLEKLIKGLRSGIREAGRGGGGMGNVQHERFSINTSTTSVQTAFSIGGRGTAIFKSNYQGAGLDRGIHFTVGADFRTLSFVSDVQNLFRNNTILSITYIRG